MQRIFTLIAVGILIFTFPFEAGAQFKEKGFFGGGGIGYAWENFDDDELEDDIRRAGLTSVRVDSDNAWGLNLFAGYRFMRYLAVEGNFNWYDDFEIDVDADFFSIPVSGDFDLEIWTLFIDLKAMYPVYNDRLVPYLRVGGGYMDAEIDGNGFDEDEDDFAWNLGGGVDYFLTDQVSLGLDGKYVWGTDDLDEIEYFMGTVRIGFHF